MEYYNMLSQQQYNEKNPVISFRVSKEEADMLKKEALTHGYSDIAPYMRYLIRLERERGRSGFIKRLSLK
jgi:hypothetical protein